MGFFAAIMVQPFLLHSYDFLNCFHAGETAVLLLDFYSLFPECLAGEKKVELQ